MLFSTHHQHNNVLCWVCTNNNFDGCYDAIHDRSQFVANCSCKAILFLGNKTECLTILQAQHCKIIDYFLLRLTNVHKSWQIWPTAILIGNLCRFGLITILVYWPQKDDVNNIYHALCLAQSFCWIIVFKISKTIM